MSRADMFQANIHLHPTAKRHKACSAYFWEIQACHQTTYDDNGWVELSFKYWINATCGWSSSVTVKLETQMELTITSLYKKSTKPESLIHTLESTKSNTCETGSSSLNLRWSLDPLGQRNKQRMFGSDESFGTSGSKASAFCCAKRCRSNCSLACFSACSQQQQVFK